MNHHINNFVRCSKLSGGLLLITLLSSGILISSSVSADVIDKLNVIVPASCSLLSNNNTSNTYTVTIANGVYQQPIGETVLKAICNDTNGFSIYASGYTGNEVGATNSNKLVGAGNIGNISTGIATSGATSNWAMKLTATTGTYTPIIAGSSNDSEKQQGDPDFSSYTNVPNDYVRVAYRNNSTDSGDQAVGSTLTASYAVYVSPTQPMGAYSGQVIYTLVHPANHAAPVILNTEADNISEVNYLQEFAVVGGTNRQAIIDSMVPETQYTLTDTRDGKTYTIAKYATSPDDSGSGSGGTMRGNTKSGSETRYMVWMTQNLDLDIEQGYTYTNEDTDIGYNTTTGEYDSASWTPIRSTYAPTSTQTYEWCNGGTRDSQYGYCDNNDTPESYDPGNLYWNLSESDNNDWNAYYNSCDYSTSTPSCNQSLNPISTYTSSTGTAQYHLGNYYNWAAALATNDSSIYTNYELIEQSICPAGWTLPRAGNGEDSFYALWNQYGFANNGSYNDANSNNAHDANEDALWTSPLYFAASGVFDDILAGVGYYGDFWSPVASGWGDARYAGFGIDGWSNPSFGDLRHFGWSIRCVARPVSSSYIDTSIQQ